MLTDAVWTPTTWTLLAAGSALTVAAGVLAKRVITLNHKCAKLSQEAEAASQNVQNGFAEKSLVDLSLELLNEITFEAALPKILHYAIQTTSANGGAIYQYDGQGRDARVVAEQGLRGSIEQRLSSHLVVANRGSEALSFTPYYGLYKAFLQKAGSPVHDKIDAKSIAVVPMRNRDESQLCMHLFYNERSEFDDAKIAIIERLKQVVNNGLLHINTASRLKQTLAFTESHNRSTKTLLQNIGYEIRTSLTSVVGATEVLRSLGIDSNQTAMVSYIEQSAQELNTTLSQALEFAHIEDHTLILQEDKFDVRSLLGRVLSLFHPWAVNKNIRLSFSVDSRVPFHIFSDEARIEQILINLIGSALRYTLQGHLRLDVHAEVAPLEKMMLHFTISDTGIGLSKSKLQSLFSLIDGSIDASHSLANQGGLALAVTKKIVEFMGGEIGVEPAGTQGSTFWFTVPAHTSQETESTLEKQEAKKPASTFIELLKKAEQGGIPPQDVWAKKEILARLSGDRNIVIHLKSLFDATTPEKILQLRQATVRNDRTICNNLSHELKGVAQNLALPRFLESLIMYREQLIEKEKEPEVLLLYIDLVKEEFERVRAMAFDES